MADDDSFQLETKLLGPLPIVDHFLSRLGLSDVLGRHLELDGMRSPGPVECANVVVRNIVLARTPVYELREWAEAYHPSPLGIDVELLEHLNDDRVGRVLDRIFDADRASMLTELVMRAIKEFDIDLEQIHNDSTTITFHGVYKEADGGRKRGKKSAAIQNGHNKDHRPDLKQLLWDLSVSADGAVPIHYRVHDGSTEDSTTHRETWDVLRALGCSPDFMYVADCKLCTAANMKYIDSHGGRFLCVMPRSRTEDAWFREYIQTHPDLAWEDVHVKDNRDEEGKADLWRMVESPMPSSDGYRIVWLSSARKAEQDRHSRQAMLEKRSKALEVVRTRIENPRGKLNTHDKRVKAVEVAIGKRGARYIDYAIEEAVDSSFKQAGPGRPGPNTEYKKVEKKKFTLRYWVNEEVVHYDAVTDGMWPLITNQQEMLLQKLFDAYRFQPRLEKRHEQFKNAYLVAPVFLKKITRIEGLLFLFFTSMLIGALIERQVRKGMDASEIEKLKIYPEDRGAEAPTTERILRVFDNLQIHRLRDGGEFVKLFRDELSDKQLQVLGLAQVPPERYTSLR